MKTYSTLIITAGASMESNLKDNDEAGPLYEKGSYELIGKKMAQEKWGDPESARFYGSEINSTVSLVRNFERIESGRLVRANLFILVSDTDVGRNIGSIVKPFFMEHPTLSFDNVQVVVIEDLKDNDEQAFAKNGLRNLVRKFAEIARKYRDNVLVNPTGGYKAQIAFALALGQAMKFPIYYRFERFNKVIRIPPLPVSLDWELYLLHHKLLETLEVDMILENALAEKTGYANYAEIPESVKTFIDREKIDKEQYLALSAMGQVFLESARERIKLDIHLSSSKKKPEEKIKIKNHEENARQFNARHRVLERLAEIPFVDLVRQTGYGENFDKNQIKAKLGQNPKEVQISYGAKGGILHVVVETTASNEREGYSALLRIKEILA